MKKILCIIFTLLILLPLISCGDEPVVPTDNTFGVVNYISASKLIDKVSLEDMKKLADQPSEKSYTIDKEYNLEEGDVVITAPGVYRIGGTTNENSVRVALSYSAKSKEVTLILDGATIGASTDKHDSAIYSSGVELTIVLVGENSLSDDTSNEDKGVITVKNGSLTFDGIGTLNLNTSAATNGIYTNGRLTVNGGIFNIEANNHGIYSKGDMTLNGGEFNINSQRHGIKCGDSPEVAGDEANKATLTINGGCYDIKSVGNGLDVYDKLVASGCGIRLYSSEGNGIKSDGSIVLDDVLISLGAATDGIDAEGNISITGKSYVDVTSYGDGIVGQDVSINCEGAICVTTLCDYAETALGSYILRNGSYVKVNPLDYPNEVFYDQPVSCKGIKTLNKVDINCSKLVINSAEDGIHGLDVNIKGGALHVITEEDGIHAENVATISNASINIHKSYKGIKGLKATLSSSTVAVVSFSDAIDATDVLIEGCEAYFLDKIDIGLEGSLAVNSSTVVIVSNSNTPTIPTNKDISYVKCVVLKPQMAVSDRYIRVSGEGIDITLKLSKSFKDKMSVTLISDKMEKGQYYASIGTYEGEFDEIFKNGIELSDTYAQKLTVQ